MSCKPIIKSSFCKSLIAKVDCVEQIYQGESKTISIQLIDLEGYALDMDTVDSIQAVLYDSRDLKIAKYYYPDISISPDSHMTYEIDETELDPYNDAWVDNLSITSLQLDLMDSSNSFNNSNGDDFVINKGKIEIVINEELTNYLMVGGVYLDIRIVDVDSKVYIIKCFQIGKVEKNKFK